MDENIEQVTENQQQETQPQTNETPKKLTHKELYTTMTVVDENVSPETVIEVEPDTENID